MIFISIILRCTLDLWLMIRKTFFTTKTWYLHSSFTLFYSYILPTSCLLVFPFYLSIPSMPFSFSLSTCIEGIVYLSIDRYPNALILRVDSTYTRWSHSRISLYLFMPSLRYIFVHTYLPTLNVHLKPSLSFSTFAYLVPMPFGTLPLST